MLDEMIFVLELQMWSSRISLVVFYAFITIIKSDENTNFSRKLLDIQSGTRCLQPMAL